MSIISWGRTNRYDFSACGGLDSWVPEVRSGVFAITYRRDPVNKPKAHTVFFFGECENLPADISRIKSNLIQRWQEMGGTPDDLYVFVHPMNDSTKLQRAKVQQNLVLQYQPEANIAD
ncbi:MAG: hypothetical protein K2X27_07675 [Candidatus Obscuribacterales bacterium]|nr:hypothetical protein [Candidatus Obscuribacterales bacterium]